MKKKTVLGVSAILLAFSLTGCAAPTKQKTTDYHPKSTQVKNKKKQPKVKKGKSQQGTKVQKKTTAVSKKQPRMQLLTAKLRQILPGMVLPQRDGLGQGSQNLNVCYVKNNKKASVFYSVGDAPLSFNNSSLKFEKPFAMFTEWNSLSANEAAAKVNYQPRQSGLPTVRLNEGTNASTQGGAGQKYVQWNKNNWSFVVQGGNQLKQDPVERARETISLGQKYALPKTSRKGSVQIVMGDHLGSLNTTITWQIKKKVYQLKAHSTDTAFKMLNSLK